MYYEYFRIMAGWADALRLQREEMERLEKERNEKQD